MGTNQPLYGKVAYTSHIDTPLSKRERSWPNWKLLGPLELTSREGNLFYPPWFEGLWKVKSMPLDNNYQPTLQHLASFQRDEKQRLISDRAFNTQSIGKAALGKQLIRVLDDPISGNRQVTFLEGGVTLETTVLARRQESLANQTFFTDELMN